MLINQILNQIINGERESDAALVDELIRDHPDEGTWHDFKDGLVTKNKDEAALKLRRFVTGFANADGGLLVLGVSESKPRTVSSCSQIGGGPLDEWATRVLSSQAPLFGIQPRIREVNHPNGRVLLVAAARAPQLVSYVAAGKPVYPIRIGESTVDAPDYLISDLLLGRRTGPVFDLTATDTTEPSKQSDGHSMPAYRTTLKFQIQNVSLVSADSLTSGEVWWTWSLEEGFPKWAATPPLALKQYLDIREPQFNSRDRRPWHLVWRPHPSRQLPVFQVDDHAIDVWLPESRPCASLAVYVVADGTAPQWFEIGLGNDLKPAVRKLYSQRAVVSIA